MVKTCPKCGRDWRINDNNVDHPKHYNMGKIEVIKVIKDWNLCFWKGNAVKYIARSQHKGNEIEDLKKAIWYLNDKIKDLEEENK